MFVPRIRGLMRTEPMPSFPFHTHNLNMEAKRKLQESICLNEKILLSTNNHNFTQYL